MAPRLTPAALAQLVAPLRQAGVRLVGVGGLALVLTGLAVPTWLARLGIVRSPLWVVVAWLLAFLAAGLSIIVGRRVWRHFSATTVALTVERSGGWRHGAVTSLLEATSEGTSLELLAAADQSCATSLGERGAAALEPERRRWAGWARIGHWALAAGAVGFAAVGPHRGVGRQLWSPGAAWASFLAPVQLVSDRTTVDRGESVRLDLRAAGRSDAKLWLRAKGEPWRSESVALDSTGRATKTIGPLEGDFYALLQSGGRTSDTVLVHVRMPAFLGRLAVTANYPAYLRLEDETLPTTGDTLLLPAGTRLSTVGESTADLAVAQWNLGGASVPLDVRGREFRGAVLPRATGVLELELQTADGAPIGGDPIRIPVVVVPDRAPEVDVPVPGQDTMPVLGNELALVIDARDDHGLASVVVMAQLGRSGSAPMSNAIPLPSTGTDRALLSTRLDLARFALTAGDTLAYWVVVRDNAPQANATRSRTFVLVVPTTVEARAEQRSASKQVAKTIDSLVNQAKQLQRETEDLSRERQRNSSDKGDPSLGFEEAKKAEQVARDQQDLMDQAEALKDQLEQLDRATEKSGVADSAFRKQLDDIRQQLDKALTPEMRKRLDELREALKNLDPQGTKDALKKLADAQEKLKEALERTRELFKRAALEGELGSLEQESKEVAEQQKNWNEQVNQADSSAAGAKEQALAERADSVAQGLEQAAKQMKQEERQEALKESAQQAKQAAQSMRDAAKSAKSGKKQAAKKQGEDAAAKMEEVQKDVKEQKDDQQDEWRQEVIDALDRALAETARLSQRQLAVSNSVGRGTSIAQSRLEQGVLEEGVQKIVEQVLAVSGKNALVSPQIGVSLVQARLQMARAREAISSASANLREAAEQAGEAVDALNVAAFQMLRARDDVQGSSSGSGLAEAMQKMQQMAGQQGSMSQEGNNLLSMLAGQQMQGQLQAMAQRQRQLARDLERLRAETQAPGTRDLAEEARELARKLEAGRIDRETVDRQERLFKRMLDAGRTLQGEEKDEKKERESTTAKTDSLSIPASLRRLLDRSGQIRLPSWDELQRLSPEERRLVTDYFRRLTAQGKP